MTSAWADIVDTAIAAGSFGTLAAALTEAGLVEVLKGSLQTVVAMGQQYSHGLSEARNKGIKIIAVQIKFDGKMIYYCHKIPLLEF